MDGTLVSSWGLWSSKKSGMGPCKNVVFLYVMSGITVAETTAKRLFPDIYVSLHPWHCWLIFMCHYLDLSVGKIVYLTLHLCPNISSEEWQRLSPPVCALVDELSDQVSSTVHTFFLGSRKNLGGTCDQQVSKTFAKSKRTVKVQDPMFLPVHFTQAWRFFPVFFFLVFFFLILVPSCITMFFLRSCFIFSFLTDLIWIFFSRRS